MRRAAPVLVLASAIVAAGPALAAPRAGVVEGTVSVTRAGKRVDASGVVVYVVGFKESPPRRVGVIRQRGQKFSPALLPITAGQSVVFPNLDPFFHNVFSPSPARRFDLGQYPEGETKGKRFPKVGVVEVFCNIHPDMAATVLVLPNRRFARASRRGGFRIRGVPPGTWTVYAYSRLARSPARARVTVRTGRTTRVELALVERPPAPHKNKFGERYRDPEKYR